MLQKLSYMAVSIPNNFLFIFLIIANNYWKVKMPETEIEESIRRCFGLLIPKSLNA